MSNKIFIILAVVIVGAFIWYGYSNLTGGSTAVKTTRLDTYAHSLSLSYPKSWGSITGEPTQKDLLPGDFPDIRRFIFADYPNKTQTSTSGLIIQEYAAQFASDPVDPEGPWWASKTAEQKNAIIKPLLTIYQQRSVNNVLLSYWGETAADTPATIRGWWWGNESASQHRMNITYLENQAGDLRGVGYFSNSGQEDLFYPAYTIVLINPAKRVVIEGDFPVSDMSELSKWVPNIIGNSMPANWSWESEYEHTAKGETYLNDPANYATTELGQFVITIRSLVGSMSLIK